MTEKYSLADLQQDGIIFEHTIKGTDGSLWDKNTIEYGLKRGVIGEAQEALEELEELIKLQVLTPDKEDLIRQTYEKLAFELVDVLIFLISVFSHVGLSADEVMELARIKMEVNRKKYDPRNFESKTIAEGLQYSRDKWRMGSNLGSGNNGSTQEADQFEYFTGSASSPS